jgi:rfaE bifunctional protein kinase chain/domain
MARMTSRRVQALLRAAAKTRILVIGDVMLDHFVWGRVNRISPEAPVPVVDFERENFMPGGAANVARNLTSLGGKADLCGLVGKDEAATILKQLLEQDQVGTHSLHADRSRPTARKIRIVAGQQQVARLDREVRGSINASLTRALVRGLEQSLKSADAIIVADYGKGVVTQGLLDALRARCRPRAKWLSVDPKPVHPLNLEGLSLLTPNRKEAFELAGLADTMRHNHPLEDASLLRVADKLMAELSPAVLLITLGELGLLLCQRDVPPIHIATVAREVFDVSGAGDTVIASFTLAIAAGASPLEAAIFSNHAAGVVVGKRGTATVSPAELLASFRSV